jgi:S1-C subfamily serine protease
MKSVALAVVLVVPLASLAHAQQEDVDKIHVRLAKKVAAATVAVEGGTVRGSGVIIDKTGIILTSPTAVGTSSSRVTVFTQGSRSYAGKVLGRANDRELVVVKIDAAQDLPFIDLGDSDAAKPGQIAYVFGDSYDSIRSDDQAAMSLGAISGIYELTQRHEKSLYTGKVLETSAAVNPSQNGGPLVDR